MLEYARPLVASRTEHDCRWTFLSHACGRPPLLVTRFFQQFAWNRGVVRIAPFTSFSPFCERRHIIISLSCLSVCVAFEVTVTSLHPPRLCRIAVFSIKPTFLSVQALQNVAPIHLSPLPCSDLGQGVAISTTAFKLPRFFVQTHIFSVSPSSFSL